MNATAVLISGQTRTFRHCFPTQNWNIYRKLHQPHFFVSVTDDEQAKDMEVLREHYEHVWIERVTQPDLDAETTARYLKASAHAAWGISVPVIAIWRQLWHLNRVWEFAAVEHYKELKFTAFIRIRPDLHIHNFTIPETLPDARVFVPWWGSWGGIPDRLAFIADQRHAYQYFTTFLYLDKMLEAGCPFHPETMLGYNLARQGVPVSQTLDAEFTTIRMPGDKRPHDAPSYSNRDVFRYINERLAEGPARMAPAGSWWKVPARAE